MSTSSFLEDEKPNFHSLGKGAGLYAVKLIKEIGKTCNVGGCQRSAHWE